MIAGQVYRFEHMEIKIVYFQPAVKTKIDSLNYVFRWWDGTYYPFKDRRGKRHPRAGQKCVGERIAFPGQVVYQFSKHKDPDWIAEYGICSNHDIGTFWKLKGNL